MRERFKMATSSEGENSGSRETKIPCGSKRSLEAASDLIFSTVNDVIGKNTLWSDDQKERLRRRFHEVYETAVHDNIEFDGQTWADVEAHEDGESTQEFEAVNLERQNQVQDMAGDLDTLLVDTTTKRSQYPRKITQKVAQRLQCQHEAVVNHKPLLLTPIVESSSQDIVNTQDDGVTERLTSAGQGIAAYTKELPFLEDKAVRLRQAIEMQNATSGTRTHHIISKPHPEENKLATSMTPLKRRLDETPSSSMDDKISRGQVPKKELRNHPIKKYKLQTPSTS
ncbi:kinetochore-associated protein NSL1 homolog [Amphiura filiformis]|uniref:kinetochore-associated protein NSL1 homolog n=1 Tax=Amphiura filiformis TaxID=82378 RepID=UPI003B22190C